MTLDEFAAAVRELCGERYSAAFGEISGTGVTVEQFWRAYDALAGTTELHPTPEGALEELRMKVRGRGVG